MCGWRRKLAYCNVGIVIDGAPPDPEDDSLQVVFRDRATGQTVMMREEGRKR
jgi:hypothetical protein